MHILSFTNEEPVVETSFSDENQLCHNQNLLTPIPQVAVTNYSGRYFIAEIEKVRKQLIEDLYDVSINASHQPECNIVKKPITLTEINMKRKLGIFTQEVIEFFVENKKPCNLQYDEEFNSEDIANTIDNNDCVNNLNTQEVANSQETIVEQPQIEIKTDEIVSKFTTNIDIELTHSCEENLLFCPKKVKFFNETNPQLAEKKLISLYICDFCTKIMFIEVNMLKHLEESEHLSASLYYTDESQSISEESKFDIDKLYLKSRCKLKNLNSTLSNKWNIFCPKCFFVFDTDLLACCMHYKYTHRTFDEYIYSINDKLPIKQIDIELSRKHVCLTCDLKFKKLTDLMYHLEVTKHFPFINPNDELINVFYCPVDTCSFKVNNYSTFRVHILTHQNLVKQLESQESNEKTVKLTAKCRTFMKPTNYYHLKQFGYNSFNDHIDELEAIKFLLDTLKGHSDQQELVKKVKARKDELHKLLVKIK